MYIWKKLFYMNELLDPEKNTSEQIDELCRKHNISVSELCRRAKVRRQLLNDWKGEDPKSIIYLKRLNAELLKIQNADDSEITEVEFEVKQCDKDMEPCKFKCSESQCKLID